jgi:hypothetical protein
VASTSVEFFVGGYSGSQVRIWCTVPQEWSFLKHWAALDAMKTNDKDDQVLCFNVIFFYVEILVVKEVLI